MKMDFETLLRLALIPTYFSLTLCLITAILITHYWLLGDFFTKAYLTIIDPPSQKKVEIFIDFLPPATDAAIVSASTALIATIIAIIAWYKLRRSSMDLEVNLPRRRFWVGFVFLTSTANFASAFAALVLHYTQKGPDAYGCRTTTDASGIVNMACTREMAACKVMPAMIDILEKKSGNKWAVPLSCNEAVAVKWFQLIIMFNAIALFGMFALQAWVRKQTRGERVGAYSKDLLPYEEP
ncbi:hypothetical protein K505DRAFT_323280 [Melanomma pulvis-pyrius CBS 109.77]|uniref:Uncharacterized protein n=1 Tax=Melanomma pulvis-pyrius CBS 109.77 TaxID=1314802 RepID=A0A6A6XK84_9PLEO|nr:hypothetical protein K505DRAFT_323280 [Melanomma pulvis-pyrius CBS 109.77]